MTRHDPAPFSVPSGQKTNSEQGSILVAVLCFLTIFSLLIASGVLLASTHLKAGVALRQERDETYNVEAAAQLAINNIRANAASGRIGEACPSVNYSVYTVTCTPQTGSGAASGSGGGGVPAITQLAANTTGIVFGSSNQMTINGDVRANGQVSTNGPGVVINGALTSSNNCWGTFSATTQTCPISGVAATDPNWAPNASTAPTTRAVPACPASRVVKFTAGTYTNLNALNLLSNGVGCTDAVLWFQPGIYYFNFSGNWNLGGANIKVVGGAALGWNTNGTKPAIPFPNACDATKPGVQFIFGGGAGTTVSLNKSSMELCGPKDTNNAAIYQLKSQVGSMTAWKTSACKRCDLVQVGGSSSKFAVHGAVYTPFARFNINLSSTPAPMVTAGIIAQVVYLTVGTGTNPVASGWVGATTYGDRIVVFTVTGPGSKTMLTTKVDYSDGGGSTPGAAVEVASWTLAT